MDDERMQQILRANISPSGVNLDRLIAFALALDDSNSANLSDDDVADYDEFMANACARPNSTLGPMPIDQPGCSTRVSCVICGREFSDESELNDHYKIHYSNRRIDDGLGPVPIDQSSNTAYRPRRLDFELTPLTTNQQSLADILAPSAPSNAIVDNQPRRRPGRPSGPAYQRYELIEETIAIEPEHRQRRGPRSAYYLPPVTDAVNLPTHVFCEICGARFRRESQLNEHRRIHASDL